MTIDLVPQVSWTVVLVFVILLLIDLLEHVATGSPLFVVLFERCGQDFRIFLTSCFSNVFAANAADYRVIQTNPFAAVLSPDVYGVVAKVSRFAMVVDYAS